MNTQFFSKTIVFLFLTALFIPFQNCSKQTFSSIEPSNNVSQGNPVSCREEFKRLTTPIEMVFVVDVSGSNQVLGGKPGTDPQKVIRAGSIQAFFDTYKDKANFKWNLTYFNNNRATTLAKNADATVMAQAISDFFNVTDTGNTPYEAALNEAESIVKNDPAYAPDKKYIVVFWSDGMPNPAITDMNLAKEVLDIVEAFGPQSNQVSLNSVYYGPVDMSSSQRLNMMATVGKGNFIDTNQLPPNTVFTIEDLVVIPETICTTNTQTI